MSFIKLPARFVFEIFYNWMFPAVGTIAGIIGIAGGALSLYNGMQNQNQGTGNASSYQYIPQYARGLDTQFNTLQGEQYNAVQQLNQTVDPQLRAILAGQMGQDYSALQGLSPQLQQIYAQLAQQDPQFAAMLTGAGQGQIGAGNAAIQGGMQTLNTAMDPMGSAKANLWQQILDSTRAGESARGLAMGPQGAGIESNAATQFGTQWDLNQLQRQTTGLQALQSGMQAGGQAIQGGAQNIGAGQQYALQGGQNLMAGAQVPQTLNDIIAANKMQALNQYASGVTGMELAPMAGAQGNFLNYIGQASNAGANAYNIAANQRNFAAGQQGMGAYGAMQGLGALQKLYGGQQGNTGSGGAPPPVYDYSTTPQGAQQYDSGTGAYAMGNQGSGGGSSSYSYMG
jgi:hypothetical protein